MNAGKTQRKLLKRNIKMKELNLNLLTEEDAAKIFCISKQALQARRYRGQGPAFHKIGKSIYYNMEDINLYVEKTRIDPERIGKRA